MSRSKETGRKPKATKVAKNASSIKPKVMSGGKKAATAKVGSRKLKDVKESIYRSMCEQASVGVEEVTKADLAIENDYTNPRSEGFAKAVKELKDMDGLIEPGSTKDTLKLTEKGRAAIPDDIDSAPKDLKSHHERYINMLMKKIKGGANKIRDLWEILLDRKPHTIEEIAKKLGYGNVRSFANTKIIATMKQMGIVDEVDKKAVKMADKMFIGGVSEV